MTKISMESSRYKRVEKNLKLENFSINQSVALKAVQVVNSGEKITASMIKDVIKIGKI